jgi:hypothetical protein
MGRSKSVEIGQNRTGFRLRAGDFAAVRRVRTTLFDQARSNLGRAGDSFAFDR